MLGIVHVSWALWHSFEVCLILSYSTNKEIVASERLSTLTYATQPVLDKARHNPTL